MPKQEAIAYKANFKAEVDEEGNETAPAFSYDGTVLFNMHESTSDAIQMWGEQPASDAIYDSIKIKVQNLARKYRTQAEAQDAVNGLVPGVKRTATGVSMKQVRELLATKTPAEIKLIMEDIARLAAIQQS